VLHLQYLQSPGRIMIYIGAFAKYARDTDLYLVRAILKGEGRVRLLRWSDGYLRTTFEEEVSVLSINETAPPLEQAVTAWNRRMALLNNTHNPYGLGFLDEIKLCLSNSLKFETRYNHRETGGLHLYRHDFIREYFIHRAWSEVYDEPFITNKHIIRRVLTYCQIVQLEPPTRAGVERRLAVYWRRSESQVTKMHN
jgi:hypothetical protein